MASPSWVEAGWATRRTARCGGHVGAVDDGTGTTSALVSPPKHADLTATHQTPTVAGHHNAVTPRCGTGGDRTQVSAPPEALRAGLGSTFQEGGSQPAGLSATFELVVGMVASKSADRRCFPMVGSVLSRPLRRLQTLRVRAGIIPATGWPAGTDDSSQLDAAFG